MHSYEQPLIGKWHQGQQIEDSQLGRGAIAEVRRRVFETATGPAYYAYKPMPSEQEAVRTADMYARLQAAGLPVVSFLKTTYRKDDTGVMQAGIAMEDVTEYDRYKVYKAQHKKSYVKYGDNGVRVVNFSEEFAALQQDMVQGLAVMHNNGLYDYHPGISFFIRLNKEDPRDVTYRILDYSNICYQAIPEGWFRQSDTFEEECESDAQVLISRLAGNLDEEFRLQERYWEVRSRGDVTVGTLTGVL